MSKQLIDVVFKKKEELKKIHAALELNMNMDINLSRETVAKIKTLEDRLEYRVLQYDDQLLTEKIAMYKQALEIVKNESKKSTIRV